MDRRQLLFATLMVVPAMLVGTLVLLFADPGGPDADEPPDNSPIGLVTPSFSTPSPPTTTTTGVAPPQSSLTTEVIPAPAPPAKESPFDHGIFGVHPHAGEQAEEWQASRPADAALMKRMASVPTATWFGDWTSNVRSAAADLTGDAAGKRPVIVTYNLPGRDCGGYSGGGAGDESAYREWIRDLAAGIADRPAAVVLEPDALGQLCGDADAKYRMLAGAIEVLEAGARTDVYLDAGHALWLDVPTAAQRLRAAGVAKARGFSLNVSNFVTTGETERYGEALVNALGGSSHYVVDTSRNGNGPGADWCNPPGRALGAEPTADTAAAHADAYLWIKVPGESDGTCGGAPPAGTWMPEYALGLAREVWS